MKRIVLAAIVAMVLGTPASAAGIDSRVYTCAALHAVIAAHRFVFISAPAFGDFVVADAYYCSGGETVDLRSVPTSDNPQCSVRYCTTRSVGGGGWVHVSYPMGCSGICQGSAWGVVSGESARTASRVLRTT